MRGRNSKAKALEVRVRIFKQLITLESSCCISNIISSYSDAGDKKCLYNKQSCF